MALSERENTEFGSDVGTRALSVIAVENHFVERVYEKLANVYDLIFGPTLHPGRLVARDRMGFRPGDHVQQPSPRDAQVRERVGFDVFADLLGRVRRAMPDRR